MGDQDRWWVFEFFGRLDRAFSESLSNRENRIDRGKFDRIVQEDVWGSKECRV